MFISGENINPTTRKKPWKEHHGQLRVNRSNKGQATRLLPEHMEGSGTSYLLPCCLIIKIDILSAIEFKCSSMSVQNTWQGSMLTIQHKFIHSLECGYLQTPRGDSEFLLQCSELQHLPEAFD